MWKVYRWKSNPPRGSAYRVPRHPLPVQPLADTLIPDANALKSNILACQPECASAGIMWICRHIGAASSSFNLHIGRYRTVEYLLGITPAVLGLCRVVARLTAALLLRAVHETPRWGSFDWLRALLPYHSGTVHLCSRNRLVSSDATLSMHHLLPPDTRVVLNCLTGTLQ